MCVQSYLQQRQGIAHKPREPRRSPREPHSSTHTFASPAARVLNCAAIQNQNAMQLRILWLFATLVFVPCAFSQNLEPVTVVSDTLTDPDAYRRSLYLTSSLVPGYFGLEMGYGNMRRLLQAQGVKHDPVRHLFAWGLGARFHRVYLWLDFTHSIFDNFTTGESRPSGQVNVRSQFHNVGLQAGYAFWQDRNSAGLLRCGLQISRYELYLQERSGGAILNFDQFGAPSPPARTWPVMTHTGPALNIAAELLWGRPKKGQHVAFSTLAGYMIGLGQEQWRALNALGLNAPADRVSQAYISTNYWLSRNYPRKSVK
jgi:hypothetical protein